VVENNTIQDNKRHGVYVYANFNHQTVTDTIRNNTIVSNNTNNNDYYAGVQVEGYANPVIWYNDIYDNNYYDIRNNSQYNDIDARFNWWGTTTTATMDAGSNPKDISKIYDYYDDNSLGSVNYAGWLSEAGGDPPATTMLGAISLTNSSGTEQLNFAADSTLYIKVTDSDRNTNSGTAETITVSASSETETTAETVTLTETGANTGIFMGSITFAEAAASS
ncbi:uncharacterized protein METZ01_LOCUS510087, partial [marine metagenome]